MTLVLYLKIDSRDFIKLAQDKSKFYNLSDMTNQADG